MAGALLNLRSLALVFYFSLLLALAPSLTWLSEADSPWTWWYWSARYTRQSLVSGLALLLTVALAEALLAGWPLRRAGASTLRGLALLLGAMLGALGRRQLAQWLDGNSPLELVWFVYVTGLWTLMGGLALLLWHQARADAQAQQRLAQAQREHHSLVAQQLEARLLALNAQIEPHFLFNTLATVKRLLEVAPAQGQAMLSSLLAYLRAALPAMRSPQNALGLELERVRHYLLIQQMRMGERLRFELAVPENLHPAWVPTLLLLTLVENAIQHGLSPLPEGGCLTVSAGQDPAGQLWLEVADTGRGFGTHSGGSGVGLANSRARLEALHGPAGRLSLRAAHPHGVVARVELPLTLPPTPTQQVPA